MGAVVRSQLRPGARHTSRAPAPARPLEPLDTLPPDASGAVSLIEAPHIVAETSAADGREFVGARGRALERAELETLYLGFVQSYYDAIVRFILGMVPGVQQAEDLAQDTFLKAYLALPHVGPPENPRAWLYRIATNTTLDYLRRRRRIGLVALDRLAHVLRGSDRTTAVEDRDPIDRALAAIKADERAILMLFTDGQLKAPEVAEVLGITPAAARKRRQRAREAFTIAYREATREM